MTPQGHGKPIVVVVGAHPFPHGNASANRMLGLAQTLGAAGLSAMIINDDPRLTTTEDWQSGIVAGVPYRNLGFPAGGRLGRWRRRRKFGARVANEIRAVASLREVEFLCVPSFFCTPRILYALRRRAPSASVIVDVVERHDPSQFPHGRLEPYFVRHRLTSWYAKRAADRVVVISRALASGPFRSRRPFVLPPTVELGHCDESGRVTRPSGRVTVAYVGSPGSKDDLGVLVRALTRQTGASLRSS